MLRIFLVSLLLFFTSAATVSAQHRHHEHAQRGTAPAQSLPRCEATKLSEWGHRHTNCIDESGNIHKGLHERGIIDQMQSAPPSSSNGFRSCCSGVHSGECRVTLVNMREKKVFINGKWADITPQAKIVIVEGLENDEEGVVCAARSHMYSFGSPTAYCVGIRSGS
jgi:hypothetical protein